MDMILDEKEMLHRSQNDELLFYRQVASGDIEAIEENCRQHRFIICHFDLVHVHILHIL